MAKKKVKEVRTVYHVYNAGKRVVGAPEIVLTEPIEGKVTFRAINTALEKTRERATEIIGDKYGRAYPVIQKYDDIVTDEDQPYYCSTCKSTFTAKKVYGDILEKNKPKCPNGHAKTTKAEGFECPECKSGTCYDTGKRSMAGPECVVHHYECSACGHKEAEPFD